MMSISKNLKRLKRLIEKDYDKPVKNKNKIKSINKSIQDETNIIIKKLSNADTRSKKRIEKVIVKNIVKIELGKFYIDF